MHKTPIGFVTFNIWMYQEKLKDEGEGFKKDGEITLYDLWPLALQETA